MADKPDKAAARQRGSVAREARAGRRAGQELGKIRKGSTSDHGEMTVQTPRAGRLSGQQADDALKGSGPKKEKKGRHAK